MGAYNVSLYMLRCRYEGQSSTSAVPPLCLISPSREKIYPCGLQYSGPKDNKSNCNTDLNTCCSRAQGPDRGDWYFPNGNRLPIYSYIVISVLSEERSPQRVFVYYIGNGGTSGISL